MYRRKPTRTKTRRCAVPPYEVMYCYLCRQQYGITRPDTSMIPPYERATRMHACMYVQCITLRSASMMTRAYYIVYRYVFVMKCWLLFEI